MQTWGCDNSVITVRWKGQKSIIRATLLQHKWSNLHEIKSMCIKIGINIYLTNQFCNFFTSAVQEMQSKRVIKQRCICFIAFLKLNNTTRVGKSPYMICNIDTYARASKSIIDLCFDLPLQLLLVLLKCSRKSSHSSIFHNPYFTLLFIVTDT